MKPRAAIFVPGILQRPAGVDDWADFAVAWAQNEHGIRADRYEYESGATTRSICQNRRVRDVATLCGWYRSCDVNLVGHSNGCEIICRLLRDTNVCVRAVHLFAGACDADFDKNGLNGAYAAGRVKLIFVYGSDNDSVLSRWAAWSRKLFGWAGLGYGDLGRRGPTNALAPFYPEWRHEFGHSTWFEPANLPKTLTKAMR